MPGQRAASQGVGEKGYPAGSECFEDRMDVGSFVWRGLTRFRAQAFACPRTERADDGSSAGLDAGNTLRSSDAERRGQREGAPIIGVAAAANERSAPKMSDFSRCPRDALTFS
eukprot:evm.model.scf_332.4 EVM.evm.TU.scf_332.4   scf_332:42743-43081(+)